MWAMSLFSMLLTCFTMEQTMFTDYEGRLKLDDGLLRVRSDFERYKEQVREIMKVRYNVQNPQPTSLIHAPPWTSIR
jgi:hypothetical protein